MAAWCFIFIVRNEDESPFLDTTETGETKVLGHFSD
jgi:hypothetical protein